MKHSERQDTWRNLRARVHDDGSLVLIDALMADEGKVLAEAEGWLSPEWIKDMRGARDDVDNALGRVLVLLPSPVSPLLLPVTIIIKERRKEKR